MNNHGLTSPSFKNFLAQQNKTSMDGLFCTEIRNVSKKRMIRVIQTGISLLSQALPSFVIHSLLSTCVNNVKKRPRHWVAQMVIQKISMHPRDEPVCPGWTLAGMQDIADVQAG